jgi:hypothetical protein
VAGDLCFGLAGKPLGLLGQMASDPLVKPALDLSGDV